MLSLLDRVELPPVGPVLAVVLGRVEVTGHAPVAHLGEEILPLLHGPRPPVEPLDDAADEGSVAVVAFGPLRAAVGLVGLHHGDPLVNEAPDQRRGLLRGSARDL